MSRGNVHDGGETLSRETPANHAAAWLSYIDATTTSRKDEEKGTTERRARTATVLFASFG